MLYTNDFFEIHVKEKTVFLRLKKKGYSVRDFDDVLKAHPRIKISSFATLRQALTIEGQVHEIGDYMPLIEITIAHNKMSAELTLHVTQEEFDAQPSQYLSMIQEELKKKNITSGILPLSESFNVRETQVIAKGQDPIQGGHATVSYIQMPERKPVLREDGSADLYDLNFVVHVEKGEWLGEKKKAQPGIPGFTIFGEPIEAKSGQDQQLYYDKKTIEEVDEGDKIVLRALYGGALQFKNAVVSVDQQLVIPGNVGPETGSLKFDGSIVIQGTVMASYSVIASGDISIESLDSVTNAKEIRSVNGSIFIKGGMFGANSTKVEAKEAIYIKHCNNGLLKAKEVHVGAYLLGTEVDAERVFVDRHKGKIIGGHIRARDRIESAYAGNTHERPTHLEVVGIPKKHLKLEATKLAEQLKIEQDSLEQLESNVEKVRAFKDRLVGHQKESYETLEQEIMKKKDLMKRIELVIYKNLQQMKIQVTPQIEVTREAHPGVVIQIEKKQSVLHAPTKGVFEIIGDDLNV